ncbi:MFS transporter, CP family, cyanate transporter [Thermomonospora echinospora]|uniref:MFS transporter, CP family, cyanate transporter n=1 Tax=Thermomonospora echinospora TaxID=1992 RepID=A0A1H6DCE7_9ACTN|nr:MFS transporter [Thermomonospora echinospora]SEG82802.1 MFS transporter, CP family, cyanate transporter [Thermomonospora echinospora]
MSSSTPRVSRSAAAWTVAGLVLLALNLRAAITGVSPLLDDLQHALGLSTTAMGVLTTLPVLCLGAFAALAPPLARRVGTEVTLTGALLLIMGGILLRSAPWPGGLATAALFAGTAMAGAGIAIGNVLMPYVIKSAFPERVGLFTGLAMMLMSTGAALSSGLAVPLNELGGWRTALAVWAVPALVGVSVWAPLAVRRRAAAAVSAGTEPSASPGDSRTTPGVSPQAGKPADTVAQGAGTASDVPPQAGKPTGVVAQGAAPRGEGASGSVLRSRLAWYVTLFMGMQSLTFYVLMSWLPAIMRDHGYTAATAGLMLSVTMLLGIPTGMVMPVLAARRADQRPLVVAVMALLIGGVAGLLLAPEAGWLWTVVLGIALGAAFPLAFTLITLRSATPRAAAELSGMAQTTGYLLAGAGPFLIGVLNEATGGWRVPLAILLVWLLPETLFALRAARPGHVGTTSAADLTRIEPTEAPRPQQKVDPQDALTRTGRPSS